MKLNNDEKEAWLRLRAHQMAKTIDDIAELQDQVADQEDIIKQALSVIKKLKVKIRNKERALKYQ